MAGAALSQFLDFWATTGPAIFSSIDEVVNEAQRPNYLTKWLLTGDSANRLQGGAQIKDFVMFDAGNTAYTYLPGGTRTYSNPQVLDSHQGDWRFIEDHMMIVETDPDLQSTSSMNSKSKFQTYKNIIAVKKKRLATSLSNKMEDLLHAFPNATRMEGNNSSALDPYSIYTFVNEYGGTSTNFFDSTGLNPGGLGQPNAFTNIEGLNPSTQAGWRCWQANYNNSPLPSTSTGTQSANDVYDAMTKVVMATEAEEMPWKGGESTTNDVSMANDYVFMASMRGKTMMEKLARSSQNVFRLNPNDPHYNTPTFGGIPIKYIAGKNTAAHYPTSGTTAPTVAAGGATEFGSTAAVAGPRFELVSKQWFKPIFHDQHFFVMRPDVVPSAQPDVTVKIVNCWINYWCRSRRKMGIVYPTTAITGV